jgi:uncharacterized protein YutE (UPF0331/DUF86 family)
MNILQKESIEPRLDGIEKELTILREFARLTYARFDSDVITDRTQLHLRFALEGVFHIGSHILSRTAGGRFTEYKEIARKLGDIGLFEKKFAQNTLVKMAGYRNRLTHFYAEITPKELHTIIKEHLDDIARFVRGIKLLLKNPKKFGFELK